MTHKHKFVLSKEMEGIKYFKIGKFIIGSYGWHLLHDGIGHDTGSGCYLAVKKLTLGSKYAQHKLLGNFERNTILKVYFKREFKR